MRPSTSAGHVRESSAERDLESALAGHDGGGRWIRRVAITLGIVLAVGGGLAWRARHRPPAQAKYVTQTATLGDVVEKVQATGIVQPVLQVNIGAQANGRVTNVYVDFNSVVKKGDVLAEIDPTIYGTQVSQQKASLLAQRAQLDAMQADVETARLAFERTERLFQQNLASRADLDGIRGQYNAALARAASQKAALAAYEAQLAASRTNVGYTKIYSPVDGIVITRAIDPGATVVASFQAPVLFVIAQDLRKMRVMADVDEADVGKLKEQMQAEAVVDAFPGETFQGAIAQLRFSPNNVQGVVTYSAVIEVDNREEKLRPGMTATVTIKTREAKSVVRLPNAALRYRPSPPLGADGKPLPVPPEPPLAKGMGRIFLLEKGSDGGEKAEPKLIPTGITDGLVTATGEGGVKEGTVVVIDELDTKKKKGIF